MQHFLKQIADVQTLQKMFEQIKDAMLFVKYENDTYAMMYANKAAKRMLHVPDNIDVLDHNELREMAVILKKYCKTVYESKEAIEVIERIGTNVYEASISPVILNNTYMCIIIRDITTRINQENKLRQKDMKFLQALIDNNSDAVLEIDNKGIIMRVNQLVTEYTGYKKAELIGKPFQSLLTEDALEEARKQFYNILDGNTVEFETTYYTKSGEKQHLFIKNMPIFINGELVSNYVVIANQTASKKMERHLIEKEQKFRSLFYYHPDAKFLIDKAGNIQDTNIAAELITGYSRNELVGKSIISIIKKEDVEKTVHLVWKSFTQKRAGSSEITIEHKRKHNVDVFIMFVPIIIDEEIVGLYGIAEDITLRKQAQKELVQTKEELEVFWKYSSDPILLINLDGDVQKVNPAFEKTFEFSQEEIKENKFAIVPKQDVDQYWQVQQRLKKGEKILDYETKRVTKSGKVLDIISSYTPVYDENGVVVGATVFYKDVTKLKETEKELRKSVEMYKLITENAFDIIGLIDPTGYVRYSSPSVKRVLGTEPTEIRSKHITTYIHEEEIQLVKEKILSLFITKKPITIECRVKHKKGHYLWMETLFTPVLENGNITEIVLISRDVTERRKLSEKLSQMAYFDFLTGLANRSSFENQLNCSINATTSNKKIGIMMLDGREFKKINDTYGHDVGDAVIREMANRIVLSVRKTDTVARFGGDEMAVILRELNSQEEAEIIANRILRHFEAPFHYKGLQLKIGISIGLAFFPDHTTDKNLLIKYADEALYEAKHIKDDAYRVYKAK